MLFPLTATNALSLFPGLFNFINSSTFYLSILNFPVYHSQIDPAISHDLSYAPEESP
jgi:hypothetical protein